MVGYAKGTLISTYLVCMQMVYIMCLDLFSRNPDELKRLNAEELDSLNKEHESEVFINKLDYFISNFCFPSWKIPLHNVSMYYTLPY